MYAIAHGYCCENYSLGRANQERILKLDRGLQQPSFPFLTYFWIHYCKLFAMYLNWSLVYFCSVCAAECLNGGSVIEGCKCACLDEWAGQRCESKAFRGAFTLSLRETPTSVADPVIPRRGRQPLDLGPKFIIWQNICWKLCENGRVWTGGLVPSTPLDPSMNILGRANTIANFFLKILIKAMTDPHSKFFGRGPPSHLDPIFFILMQIGGKFGRMLSWLHPWDYHPGKSWLHPCKAHPLICNMPPMYFSVVWTFCMNQDLQIISKWSLSRINEKDLARWMERSQCPYLNLP